jgi:hypothetical protein
MHEPGQNTTPAYLHSDHLNILYVSAMPCVSIKPQCRIPHLGSEAKEGIPERIQHLPKNKMAMKQGMKDNFFFILIIGGCCLLFVLMLILILALV